MAKQIIEKLLDDLDGGTASETIAFGLDGVGYTIDLSEKNAEKLREALAAYITAGARQRRAANAWRTETRPNAQRNSKGDNKAIREWANRNGHQLSSRGRIPQSVVTAYETAKNAPAAPAKSAPSTPVTGRTPRKKPVPAVEFAAN